MTEPFPSEFLKQRKALLGADWNDFLESFDAPRSYGLRRNPFFNACRLPFALEPIPWAENGFFYDPEEHPGRHPLHDAGAYYIQEPSAMTVVSLLDPQPGERICDLCAAPGGKSTQIAAALQRKGLLVANEINPSRARILSQNIERMGITNALVCQESPQRMAAAFPFFFHRIAVDAPCSGEGMFRKDDTAVREWSPAQVIRCRDRQREILQYADQMLQPGGVLVYSTCTFAPEENEEIIAWFLECHPDYTLTNWHDTALGQRVMSYPASAGLCDGVPGAKTGAIAPNVLRMWPHKVRGEGHFAARLQKAGTAISPSASAPAADPCRARKKKSRLPAPDSMPALYDDFRKSFLIDVPAPKTLPDEASAAHSFPAAGTLTSFGAEWYLTPAGAPSLQGIRLLRAGLHLGTLKKKRFEPAHALARALQPAQAVQCAACDLADARKYLHGETLSCDPRWKGWTLVSYEGIPLGWGKAQNGILKNHYPKGLRREFL